jgi:hypothetical protein
MGEINKNAGGDWELFSFQVVVQGTSPVYKAVMKAKPGAVAPKRP